MSQWIRDYIYIPLGGNRGGTLRAMSVVILTMGISGLWHGANWTFVIWGLYHGFLLMGERLLSSVGPLRKTVDRLPEALWNVIGTAMMLTLTIFGWLIFRSSSLSMIGEFLAGLVRNREGSFPVGSTNVWAGLFLCAALQGLFYFDFRTKKRPVIAAIERFAVFRSRSALAGFAAGCAVAVLLLAVLMMRQSGDSAGFIYFQF